MNVNSPEQRAAALDAANKVRFDRAKLRLRVGAGEVQAWRIVIDPPACAAGVDAFGFCCWLPRIAGQRTTTILRAAKIPGHKRLDSLTPMQRERLSAAIFNHLHPAERGVA